MDAIASGRSKSLRVKIEDDNDGSLYRFQCSDASYQGLLADVRSAIGEKHGTFTIACAKTGAQVRSEASLRFGPILVLFESLFGAHIFLVRHTLYRR